MSYASRKKAMGKKITLPKDPNHKMYKDVVKTRITKGHLTLCVEGRDSYGPSVAGVSLSKKDLEMLISRLLLQWCSLRTDAPKDVRKHVTKFAEHIRKCPP